MLPSDLKTDSGVGYLSTGQCILCIPRTREMEGRTLRLRSRRADKRQSYDAKVVDDAANESKDR